MDTLPAKTEEAPVRVDYDPAYLEAVCKELGLRMVVLYGSRAAGTPPPTAESDLDLAVLAREPCSSNRWWTWYRALSEVFDGYALDLVCPGDADPLFRYEILRAGILLYGDLDDFLEYRAFAYRDFVDSADLRRLEEALFQKKMAFIRGVLYGAS